MFTWICFFEASRVVTRMWRWSMRVLRSNILCVKNNILNSESLIKHCDSMMDSVTNLGTSTDSSRRTDRVARSCGWENLERIRGIRRRACTSSAVYFGTSSSLAHRARSCNHDSGPTRKSSHLTVESVSQASKGDVYLEKIVNMTIRLESVMHQYRGFGVISSPFHCLNRYLANITSRLAFLCARQQLTRCDTRLYIPITSHSGESFEWWATSWSVPVPSKRYGRLNQVVGCGISTHRQCGCDEKQMVQIGQRNAIVLELHLRIFGPSRSWPSLRQLVVSPWFVGVVHDYDVAKS